MVTPGMTAPEASLTLPSIFPVNSWANAGVVKISSMNRKPYSRLALNIDSSPCCSNKKSILGLFERYPDAVVWGTRDVGGFIPPSNDTSVLRHSVVYVKGFQKRPRWDDN